MSEEADALRELAANRGCRLRSSRRRKPGGDHGRYGLIDTKTGRRVFGFGEAGLTATAEEIREFLRGGSASGWKTSLGGDGVRRKPKPRAKPSEPAEAKLATAAEPKPLRIREATPRDSEALAELISALGYEAEPADVRRRLAALRKAGEAPLVAEKEGLVGCLTWHVTPVLHRPGPVGRITLLVVAEKERGNGIGTALVEAVEARLTGLGCVLIEVTSNVKRLRAHSFYERLGFERTSYRFGKPLEG